MDPFREDRKDRLKTRKSGASGTSSQDIIGLAVDLYAHSAEYSKKTVGENCSSYALAGIPMLFSAMRALLIELNSGLFGGIKRDDASLDALASEPNEIRLLQEKYKISQELGRKLLLLYQVRNEIIHPAHLPAGTSHGTPKTLMELRRLGLLQTTGSDESDYIWIDQLRSHRLFKWGFSIISETACVVLEESGYSRDRIGRILYSYRQYEEYEGDG